MNHKFICSLLTFFLLTSLTFGSDQKIIRTVKVSSDTTVAELENGMTVIVKPIHTAPVVCVQSHVKTGGLYEEKWLGAGLSHLVEHLVAKGAVHENQSGKGSPQQTTGRVAKIGGQSNAYTSLARTCYYISATSSKTNECIDLIADWMARPEITQSDFNREHGVVQRELEMGKDDSNRQLWYAQAANIFQNHPAGVPVIGYAEPLSKLTYQDVLEYHSKTYIPQNMVFVVVGDVDTQQVLDKICKAFAGFDTKRSVIHNLPEVAPVASTRIVTQKSKTIKQTQQSVCFQTIPLIHDDLYALDVLSYILTNGRSSILEKKLKREKQLVTSVSSSSWTPAWGKGIFAFTLRSEPEKALPARQTLIDELKNIINNGVIEQELAKAKRQKIADLVYSQQTAENIASTLAVDYITTDDPQFSKNYTNRIQNVTALQVKDAAAKYFKFDRMIITEMVPESYEPTVEINHTKNKKAGRTEFVKLPNGIRAVLHQTDAVGLVSFFYTTKGGILAETLQDNGISTAMTTLATRGTKDYSADEISQFFDSAGGSLSAACGNNSFYWKGSVLSDKAEQAMDIFAQTIFTPTFDQKELDIIRPQLLAAIKRIDENWGSQMMNFFKKDFFIASPYALQIAGTEDIVKKLTVEDIKNFHAQQVLSPDSAGVLAVYGNFDKEKLLKVIEAGFVFKAQGQPATLPDPAPRHIEKDELHIHKTTNKVAAVVVGAAGMKVTNLEDRLAMTVLDTIISGYRLPSGWLHTELRGKQLVYVVHSYNMAGLAPGAFITYAAGQPENALQIVEIIKKNLRKTLDYTPTQTEIDIAINTILTADMLNTQSMSDLTMDTALNELYGFGYDHRIKLESLYKKVTPADVQRVAKKYLSNGYIITVTTPKPEVFEKTKK